MKLRNLLYLLLVIIVAGAWACESNSETSDPEDSTSLTEIKINEILPVVARASMAAYQEYIDTVGAVISATNDSIFQNLEKRLIYGARVDRQELVKILKRTEPSDSVYIMLGIMREIGRTATDSTELIFVTESWADTEKEPSYTYYNFTMPCPTACPGFM